MLVTSLALAGVQPASSYVPDATESFSGFAVDVPSGSPIVDTEGTVVTTEGLFAGGPLGAVPFVTDPPGLGINTLDVFQTACIDFGAPVRRVGFAIDAPSAAVAEVSFTDVDSAIHTETVPLAGFTPQQLDWEHDGSPLTRVCVRAMDDISIVTLDDVRIQRQRSLDCTPLQDESCEVVNLAANLINETGGTVIVESGASVARLRSERLYADFEVARTAALANDCALFGVAFEGAHGGLYEAFTTFGGGWSSRDLLEGGEASGTVSRRPRTFDGSLSGDDTAPIGFSFARYNRSGQAAADTGNGRFLVGHWVRTQGRRGVYALAYGVCDGDVAPSFDPWFQGALP